MTFRNDTSRYSRTHKPLLLLAAAMLLAGFGCRPETVNTNTNTVDTTNTVINTNRVAVNSVQEQSVPEEDEVKRLASSFAERYGSYSNQTNFANLESLVPFMTDRFRRQTEAFVAAERAKERDTSIYYGISTRAVSVLTERYEASQNVGIFTVQTQRKESIGSSGNTQTFQERLRILMRRQGTGWKVDEATWFERQ